MKKLLNERSRKPIWQPHTGATETTQNCGWSNPSAFTVYFVDVAFCSPLAPSGFPQNFLAVATSPRSILLTWILPLPWDRNGIITGYLINATLVETGEMLQQSSNSTSLVMNARPYTTYLFIIAAVTVAGRGPFSTEISIKTPESGKTVLSAQLKP